jgi:integrase
VRVQPSHASRRQAQPVEVVRATPRRSGFFLAAASGDRFHSRWLVVVELGLRQREMLGLAWRDVDLDQHV